MSARALGLPWKDVAPTALPGTYWVDDIQHSTSIPTKEELDLIVATAKHVGAYAFHFGLAGAALHALALSRHQKGLSITCSDSKPMEVSFFPERGECSSPETTLLIVVGMKHDRLGDFVSLLCTRKWAGFLFIGERWGVGAELLKDVDWYRFMGTIGWYSVRRTLAPTVSHLDILPAHEDLMKEAERLSGCSPPCRYVQELFVPAKEKDKIECVDPESFYKPWYEHGKEMDALSLASRIRCIGVRALLPMDIETLPNIIQSLDKGSGAYKMLMKEINENIYRILSVYSSIVRLPFTCLSPDLQKLRFPTIKYWSMEGRKDLEKLYLCEHDKEEMKLLPVCRICLGVEAKQPSKCKTCQVPLCSKQCAHEHQRYRHQ